MNKKIKVATVQFNHKPGDKNYNLSKIEYFVKKAVNNRVKIICFPEMCISGYWHIRKLSRNEITNLAESIPSGDSAQKLLIWAKKYRIIIGAGLIEKTSNGKLHNSYIVCIPNGQIKKHRKIHSFISKHISSGNQYTVFDTPLGVKIGVLICYDNNLIENVRITALKGADILLAPHQTGGTKSRSPHALGLIKPQLWKNRKKDPKAIEKEFRGPKGRGWIMRWLPSRAHDNGLFILFSNGVGIDDGEVRTGNAMVINPYGRIIKETSKVEDDLVIANLDLNLLNMCTGRRWIRGRRPELYRMLSEKTGKELDPRAARFSKKKT
jgi:predicted amidohydrolase